MSLLPKSYIKALSQRNFFVLIIITFLGQIATAFLLLTLIINVYLKTESNFAVSGVIVSSTLPGFFLMAIAGLCADLFDRKKIILIANTIIAGVVFLILTSINKIYTAIPLMFLYYGVNSFFMMAAAGASAQVVSKKNLLASNSIFVFCIAGGQVLGLMIAALLHYFFGSFVTIFICEILLILAAVFSFLLPKLPPRENKGITIVLALVKIWKVFSYIFSRKKTWFFFVMLAFMQGLIAFGVTLAPGFFREILGIGINKSLILAFPLVGIGSTIGAIFVQNPKIREGKFLSIGIAAVGVPGLILGLALAFGVPGKFLLLPICFYLVLLGFGVISSMIASRTVLQKLIPHNYQGSVFGANTILYSFMASIFSPLSAGLQALFGYDFLLIVGGLVFSFGFIMLAYGGNKWKF
ncbi:MAG TPA: MFS transporter [Candidatus Saccharimonadales bacterium]|nr:MFS transporter [Candidatus Saccharimonadales bacterium]